MTTTEANPRRFSRTKSEFRKLTFTKDAVRIAAALSRAHIAYKLEHEVIRYGEFSARGFPKFYSVDIFICDRRYPVLALELEGAGSASKDNPERDRYLIAAGFDQILHFPNYVSGNEVIDAVNRYKREET